MSLEEFITQYGYLAIFFGTFLEGETILVLAGFLAHRGYLDLSLVIAVAFAGTLFGDQLYFYIGRARGEDLIARRPAWREKAGRVFRLLDRHHILFILGFRFVYGIRTVTPFVLGASGLSPLRYLLFNVVGALIWALAIGIAGYYFGHAVELMIAEVKLYEKWIIAGLLLAGTLLWLVHFLRSGKKT